jgi:hypothetical protein
MGHFSPEYDLKPVTGIFIAMRIKYEFCQAGKTQAGRTGRKRLTAGKVWGWVVPTAWNWPHDIEIQADMPEER